MDRLAAAKSAVEQAPALLGWRGCMVEASQTVSAAADELVKAKTAYTDALINLAKALDAQRIAEEESR